MTALAPAGVNGPVWYLSALMIASALLYPLLRRFGLLPVWPVLALLLLGYASVADDTAARYSYTGVRQWLGWTYKGNIRAVAELTLGASLYPLVQYLARVHVSALGAFCLTAFKWACYGIALLYCVHPTSHLGVLTLVAMMCALVLCFSRLCCDRDWYCSPWVMWLGRFSLPLFLANIFWSRNLAFILPDVVNPWGMLLIYYGTSLLTAVVVMFLAKQLRRLGAAACQAFSAS